MELRASCCRLSWATKPGSNTLNLNQDAMNWMAPYDTPKEEIQACAICWKKCQSFGMRCYSRELTAKRISSNLQLQYWNTRKSEWLLLPSSSHEKDVLSVAAPWQCYTSYRTVHNTGHHTFWMDSVLHPLYSSHLAPSEYQLLDPLKKNPVTIITPLTSYCRTPYVSGSRGRRKTSPGWEYIPLVKGGRTLLTRWRLHWKTTMHSAML